MHYTLDIKLAGQMSDHDLGLARMGPLSGRCKQCSLWLEKAGSHSTYCTVLARERPDLGQLRLLGQVRHLSASDLSSCRGASKTSRDLPRVLYLSRIHIIYMLHSHLLSRDPMVFKDILSIFYTFFLTVCYVTYNIYAPSFQHSFQHSIQNSFQLPSFLPTLLASFQCS